MAEDLDTNKIVRAIIASIESTYGNLGFLAFRLHTVRKNHAKDMYIIKYSFIPREKDAQRLFYRAKINVDDNSLSEVQEIKEDELAKDDN